MAAAYDQGVVITRASGVDSLAMGAAQAVDLDDLCVVCIATFYSSGTGGTWTVTGSLNGTYTEAVDAAGDANSQIAIFYKTNSAAGNELVTVNPNGASADIDFTFSEISGLDGGALDVTNEATGAMTSAAAFPAVASGALAQADGILVAIASHTADDREWTPDGTYTQIGENNTNSGGQTYNAQYKLVASASSDTADWSLPSNVSAGTWFACIAAFKDGTPTSPPEAPVIRPSYAKFPKAKLAYPDEVKV